MIRLPSVEGSVSPFGNGHEEHEAETSVDDIVRIYERWSRRAAGDPRISTLSGVLARVLKTDPGLRDAADFMVEFHERPENIGRGARVAQAAYRSHASIRPLPFPEYGANLLMRGLWHEWRHMRGEIGWPEQFRSPDICEKGIYLITHEPALLDRFSENIAFRSIQTTVPDRIIGAKLELEAHRQRFTDDSGAPRPLNGVSIGHGLGVGEKKLLLNSRFENIRLSDHASHDSEYMRHNATASARLAGRLNRPLEIGNITCMDLMPGDLDPTTREWIMGCFTPNEQMNRQFMDEVEYLDSTTPDGYTSLRGDFSTRRGVEELKSVMPEKADFVLFFTIFYQLPEAERMAMLNHAAEILAPGGVIVMQDHTMVRNIINESTGEITQRVDFPGEWTSWMYKTVLIDDPNKNGWNFEPRISYKDGRAHDVYIPYRYRQQLLGSTG